MTERYPFYLFASCFTEHRLCLKMILGFTALAVDKYLICKVGKLKPLLQKLMRSLYSTELLFSDAEQTLYHGPTRPDPLLQTLGEHLSTDSNPNPFTGEFQEGTLSLSHTRSPILGHLDRFLPLNHRGECLDKLSHLDCWPLLGQLLDILVFRFQI